MTRSARLLGLAACTLALASSAAPAAADGDGRIAFRRFIEQGHDTSALFTIDPDGSGERQITRPATDQSDDQPDWAPDGSRIVFDRCMPDVPCAIYTVKPDGSALKRISPTCSASGPGVETKCEDGADPAFAPAGRRFTYTRATGVVREFGPDDGWIENSDIVVRKSDGSRPRVLVHLGGNRGDLGGSRISPDGRWLLWTRANSPLSRPAHAHAVFLARADGSHQRRLTPWSMNAGDHPEWSPDSTLIVFRSNEPNDASAEQSQIYVVHPDGTGLRRLTSFPSGTTVLSYSFSPGGKAITFARSGVDGAPDIYTMRLDGSGIRPVTQTHEWDSAPDWGRPR
jgi:Tol biopolymer transport system component